MSNMAIQKLITVLNTYSGRDKALRSAYFAIVVIAAKLSDYRSEFANNLLAFAKQFSRARLVYRQLNWIQLFYMLNRLPTLLSQLLREVRTQIFSLLQSSSVSLNSRNYIEQCKAQQSHLNLNFDITILSNAKRYFIVFIIVLKTTIRSIICHSPTSLGRFVDEVLGSLVTFFYSLNAIVEFLAWAAEAKLIRLEAACWFRYSLYCWIAALISGIFRSVRRITEKGWIDNNSSNDRLTLIGLSADLLAALNMLPSVTLRRHGKKLTVVQSALFSLIASTIGFYNQFS